MLCCLGFNEREREKGCREKCQPPSSSSLLLSLSLLPLLPLLCRAAFFRHRTSSWPLFFQSTFQSFTFQLLTPSSSRFNTHLCRLMPPIHPLVPFLDQRWPSHKGKSHFPVLLACSNIILWFNYSLRKMKSLEDGCDVLPEGAQDMKDYWRYLRKQPCHQLMSSRPLDRGRVSSGKDYTGILSVPQPFVNIHPRLYTHQFSTIKRDTSWRKNVYSNHHVLWCHSSTIQVID